MSKLSFKTLDQLLIGSKFYGTGGGGSPDTAKNIINQFKCSRISLEKLETFKAKDLFITIFTVGSLKKTKFSPEIIEASLKTFQSILNRKVKGIIPVEIGPLSVALALQLAQKLNLPIIDADFVGGRSTPEIFLETITLFNIPRTPILLSSTSGETKIILKSKNYFEEEDISRQFAKKYGGLALVLGYPITKARAQNSLSLNTISKATAIGRLIQNNQIISQLKKFNGKLLFEGKISSIKNINSSGFSEKFITITSGGQKTKLYTKNENLILWLNNKPILTCPDLIILLNQKNYPIYNLDLKLNQRIKIIGVKATKLWRSKKGVKLFNPSVFGYKTPTRLLS